jgi:hypothetical protein
VLFCAALLAFDLFLYRRARRYHQSYGG